MIARVSFYFLLYTFLVFFGTPTFLLVLQSVAIAVCGGLILNIRLRSRRVLFPRWFWVLLLSFALYISFTAMNGIANTPTTGPIAFRAAQNFVLTLCIPLIGYSLFRQGVLTPEGMLSHFAYAVVAFAVVKCVIVLVIAVLGIPVPLLLQVFSDVFHTGPMVTQITPSIIRFGTASDYAVPFALFYWLSDPARGRVSKTACFFLCAVCLFLSYSRYVWIMAIAALLLWWLSLPRKAIIIVLLVVLVVCSAAAPLIDFTPVIQRFSSDATTQSDSIRILQYHALSRDMDGYLLAGHGWASFRVDFFRDPNLPYSYEMQWLALLYQIGIIGILFVMALIGSVLAPYREISKRDVGMIILFTLSVLAAFTNPVLLGRAPGAIYAFVTFFGLATADRDAHQSASAHSHPRSSLVL